MAQLDIASPADDVSLRELLFLQRLSKAAATTVEPDELLQLIIGETTGAMRVDVCSIYLYEVAEGDVVLTATNGLSTQMVGRGRLALGHGVTGWVAQHRQPLVVPDVNLEPRFQWVRGVDQKRLTSMLSVPVVAGTRLIGVVNVQSTERREFDRGDIDFLLAIAGQVAGIIERSELQRRLQAQLEEIRASQAIHERFTELSLRGAGAGAILEAIASLAATQVDLYDPAGFRLERQGAHDGTGVARLEVPTAALHGDGGAVEVRAGKPSRTLSLFPIRAGDDLLALLAAATEDVDDEGGTQASLLRRRALEHGATVLALELAKERAAAEVERRLRGDLVEELLAPGLTAEEALRLAAQAERLGHRVAARTWVLVVEPDDDTAAAALESRGLQDRIHEVVNDLASRRFPGALVVTRPATLVILVPAEETGLRALETFARSLLDTLQRATRDGSFSLGIGNITQEVHELPRGHDEARQSLRLARRGGNRSQVTSYRNLGAFRLLLEVQNPAALGRFVDETLGPLLRYEEGRHTPLVETLEALAAQHWNRRAAARALHVHVNSLSYRVQRVETLLGASLDDPETRVALSIALRARTLLV
ncbi:MAG: helix-turn-helix domain-containing protein [Candidatus Dormibacteria bacterium]